MTDTERLRGYVDAWADCVEETAGLLRGLAAEDWARPTDLPGWDVHAVVAHLAHVESELAGRPQPAPAPPASADLRTVTGAYTEAGVAARRDHAPAALLEEFTSAAAERLASLRADPPADGSAAPPRTPGGIGWDWDTLLSNRVVDVWMHQQDVRRAVDAPGGLDTAAAAHTVAVFARAFGYVVGKRVAPPAGTWIALEVRGPHPVRVAVRVEESGRAVPVRDAGGPTGAPGPDGGPHVTVSMGVAEYVALSGGRRTPAAVAADVTGDADLGARVLAALAVTP